jgi:hypothetical protein
MNDFKVGDWVKYCEPHPTIKIGQVREVITSKIEHTEAVIYKIYFLYAKRNFFFEGHFLLKSSEEEALIERLTT